MPQPRPQIIFDKLHRERPSGLGNPEKTVPGLYADRSRTGEVSSGSRSNFSHMLTDVLLAEQRLCTCSIAACSSAGSRTGSRCMNQQTAPKRQRTKAANACQLVS